MQCFFQAVIKNKYHFYDIFFINVLHGNKMKHKDAIQQRPLPTHKHTHINERCHKNEKINPEKRNNNPENLKEQTTKE